MDENRKRTRKDTPFSLLDSGAFHESRYWDVEVVYAKADPETMLIRINLINRSLEAATIHLLPTLWFRNTWSWGDADIQKPRLFVQPTPKGAGLVTRRYSIGHGQRSVWRRSVPLDEEQSQ